MCLTHKCQTSLKKLPATNLLTYPDAHLETEKYCFEHYILDQPENICPRQTLQLILAHIQINYFMSLTHKYQTSLKTCQGQTLQLILLHSQRQINYFKSLTHKYQTSLKKTFQGQRHQLILIQTQINCFMSLLYQTSLKTFQRQTLQLILTHTQINCFMSLTHKVLDQPPKNCQGQTLQLILTHTQRQINYFMCLTHKYQTSLKKNLPGPNTLAYLDAHLEADILFYEPY